MSQRQYLKDLLRRFQMDECKPISTPMECRLKLPRGEEKGRTAQPYRELIGCLTYASLTTRPDLSAAVNFFSLEIGCPTDEHWSYLKRVLRYIKGTLDIGLEYRADSEVPLIQVFADADWANDPVDRRTVSGCLFKVAGCCVTWITRKQQVVSLSSTEAELNALCAAACFEIWLVRLLKDLGKDAELPV
ncbi:uncharacterized protein LOC134289741 [Aedes albopictus]|uniref:Reverse transcriptase Ty1/copia-type domain-containing protein n=1 Tax=Aedes albopictus TaxID=7160 RepID=A0ABM1XTR3_AEDAL